MFNWLIKIFKTKSNVKVWRKEYFCKGCDWDIIRIKGQWYHTQLTFDNNGHDFGDVCKKVGYVYKQSLKDKII